MKSWFCLDAQVGFHPRSSRGRSFLSLGCLSILWLFPLASVSACQLVLRLGLSLLSAFLYFFVGSFSDWLLLLRCFKETDLRFDYRYLSQFNMSQQKSGKALSLPISWCRAVESSAKQSCSSPHWWLICTMEGSWLTGLRYSHPLGLQQDRSVGSGQRS